MKKILSFFVLIFLTKISGQVGIGTTSPVTTLDVTATTNNGSKPEGFVAPRLTGNEIQLADAQYTIAQKGTIIYATAPATAPSVKTINMTAEGYYFFDGSVWQKLGGSASAGDATDDAWINDTANSMVKLGTNSNGTLRTAGTDFVAKDNGSVGIGTLTPDASAILDLTSSNKGFLIPRLALTGITDAITIASPATGLIVYNTATTVGGPSLAYNSGTPAAPKWANIVSFTDTSGVLTKKFIYQTLPDDTKTFSVGNLEFRASYSGNNYLFQMRLINSPATPITYQCDRIAWFGTNGVTSTTASLTFNSGNYTTWQSYTGGLINALGGNSAALFTFIQSAQDTYFYRASNHIRPSGSPFTAFVVEAF